MNTRRQTNTFNGGMNMDLDCSLINSQQYIYAENIRLVTNDSGSTGVIQNIEGVNRINPTESLNGETIIHTDTIRNWAIVFTIINNKNNIYRYDFGSDDEFPIVTKIAGNLSLDIPLDNGIASISSVCRWESDDNVKIYWCDGKHQIRILNVARTYEEGEITAETLDILPNGILPPVELLGYGSGELKAGKYQYCYQLFNPRNTETSISVLSSMFVVNSNSHSANSKDVIGDEKEKNTSKSIVFGSTLLNNNFSRAKIIRLYYKDNTAVPEISVIDDIAVSNNNLTYTDAGSSFVTELTVDEFNALSGYNFIPKVLESKNNYLFAANIKEATWDIDDTYDCRAYRCNDNGIVLLTSNSGQGELNFHIESVSTTDVPFDHDCICPYNDPTFGDTLNYKYSSVNGNYKILGGRGKNISYEFVITDLIEDDSTSEDGLSTNETWALNSTSIAFDKLPLYSIRNGYRSDLTNEKHSNVKFDTTHSKIPNYSDPEVASKLQSYQRDEIYRFAIVFYNEQNIASPAHWIADIRMPKISEAACKTFSCRHTLTLGNSSQLSKALVTHPMGIRFTVANIPANQGITGFEIVRCERTIQDRTVIAQGVLSGVVEHKNANNMLLPFPYLSFANQHSLMSTSEDYSYIWNYGKYQSNTYGRFISPDICVNRENSEELLSNSTHLSRLGILKSNVKADVTLGDGDLTVDRRLQWTSNVNTKLFNTAKQIIAIKDDYDGDDLRTPMGHLYNVSNYEYNNNDGWVYDKVRVMDEQYGEEGIEQDVVENVIRIDGSKYAYNAVLAKYYIASFNTSNETIALDKVTYIPSADPFDLDGDAWKAKGVTVGDKTYYNWCWDVSTTASDQGTGVDNTDNNNLRKTGPHGICAIVKSDNLTLMRNYPLGLDYTNAVTLCNLKKSTVPYGGQTYASRQNSVYISTGCYRNIETSNEVVNCFGGDTYIGAFDYAICMLSYNKDDYKPDNSRNKAYVGAYIPCESTINLSLRTDDFQISKTFTSDGYANHLVQNEITQIGDLYTQSKPLYAYNDAYSAQPRAKVFVSKSMYDIDNLHTDTRVLNSEVKTNNELTDSWTKFKVANYIDVDSRFGSINNMKVFQNHLLFWQTAAFGTLSVNDRSLITDNNIGALTLGTGDILSRYDYISVKNGSKENQLKVATQSDSNVYWYDKDRNEICSFGNGLNYVSKLKGVQSYLNKNVESFVDPKVVYDKKYNEVLFTLGDNTLVYNEQVGVFTSFYTIPLNHWVEFSDKLYVLQRINWFKYNAGDDAGFMPGADKISLITFVVNDSYPQTKTFDNVEYCGDFTHGTTFTEVVFQTKRQISDVIYGNNIDCREDTYKFCIPRNSLELSDISKLVNKSYKDRMKGKYLVCHYSYNCNGGNTFKVPYISTAYRPSMI